MEDIQTFLALRIQKFWATYWLAFWMLVSFAFFMSPYGSVLGFGLFWFVMGFWVRSKFSSGEVREKKQSKRVSSTVKPRSNYTRRTKRV